MPAAASKLRQAISAQRNKIPRDSVCLFHRDSASGLTAVP